MAFAELSLAERIRILAPDLPGTFEEGGFGRDAETVREVLAHCGHDAEFVIQPFGRHIVTYRNSDRADAVMTVPLGMQLSGHSTAAYIWYQNGAVYDANRISRISGLADLWGLDVVTFKDGIRLLELEDYRSRFRTLSEIANQRIHSHLLFLGRVDAVLADGLIVAEVNRRLLTSESGVAEHSQLPKVRFAPIFHPSPYKMVFRKPPLAAEFDKCYDEAYAAGVVSEIDEKYIGRYQAELGYRYLGF
ncbi:transporter substrate-binding domain-containing protein [Marinobacter sp. F4206]|nr:transporter substrate-binding domain-containing protein [Marinobacter sp. F4206]